MKNFFYILVSLLFMSCTTSNTIYEKPKNLIPKDSMVALLTDMYIASSVSNVKNKFLEKKKNYVFLVYDKYKIDSTRFSESNIYYTSKTEDYTLILKDVKYNLDSLKNYYLEKSKIKDSLLKEAPNKKLSLELIKRNKRLSEEKKSKLK
ncbi:DUF4296 domain-containing protein [Tenacibaculum salmonis]|uniref:DUF4296 domain-containing protein n=1 Tax=Tenacibaculum sp. P3-BQ1 TaxID=3232310 RepID=UPI0034DF8AB7